jgi:hypothetical protein
LRAIARFLWSFTAATVSTMRSGAAKSWPVLISASVSLGKHEPPKPGPACRNFPPIRLSRPMPRADSLAQVGDLVDEGDLGGEERVRRVLGQLGGAPAGVEDRRLIEIERPIDLGHHLLGALVGQADDDAVGMLEVLDRGALAQELGIGDDRDVGVGPCLADDSLDLVAGADRHGRLGDHHGKTLQRGRDLARGRVHVGEVGVAVAAPRRRADRDEHRVGGGDRRLESGREIEPPAAHVVLDQAIEIGLVDRDLALAQRLDLLRVLVDAGHVMAEVGEARARDEADIAGADHGDAHALSLPRAPSRGAKRRSHLRRERMSK